MTQNRLLLFFITTAFLTLASFANAAPPPLGIEEKIGDKVDLNLSFQDESKRAVPLAEFFHGQPVILSLVYFGCENMCSTYLKDAARVLKSMNANRQLDFEYVVVSIDPNESPEQALNTKNQFLTEARAIVDSGDLRSRVHYLTGSERQIEALAAQVGFGYEYDPKSKQYTHATATIFLNPTGRVERYLKGSPRTATSWKLALLEAQDRKALSWRDRFVKSFFKFDPIGQGYLFSAREFMTYSLSLFVLLIGISATIFLTRTYGNKKQS